jgi:hypothetical protein
MFDKPDRDVAERPGIRRPLPIDPGLRGSGVGCLLLFLSVWLAGVLGARGFRIRHLRLREGDALSAAARIEPLVSGAGAGDFLLLDGAGLPPTRLPSG